MSETKKEREVKQHLDWLENRVRNLEIQNSRFNTALRCIAHQDLGRHDIVAKILKGIATIALNTK